MSLVVRAKIPLMRCFEISLGCRSWVSLYWKQTAQQLYTVDHWHSLISLNTCTAHICVTILRYSSSHSLHPILLVALFCTWALEIIVCLRKFHYLFMICHFYNKLNQLLFQIPAVATCCTGYSAVIAIQIFVIYLILLINTSYCLKKCHWFLF